LGARDRGQTQQAGLGEPNSANAPAATKITVAKPSPAGAPKGTSRLARIAAPKAASSAPIPPTSILVLDSDPKDYIGRGLYQTFPSATSTITTSTTGGCPADCGVTGVALNEIQVDFVPNPWSPAWFWYTDFSAPPGQALAVGSYSGAVRSVSRTAGQPGMDISGDSSGCNALAGSFTIEELSADGSGNLVSFAATFIQHCEGAVPALTGEVRFNSTVGWSEKQISPSTLTFGSVPVGVAAPPQIVTVTSIGTAPLVIAKSSFTTVPSPSSFVVTGGSCVSGSADTIVLPSASCTFSVTTDTSAVVVPSATVRFLDNTARGAANTPASATFTGSATVSLTLASPVTAYGGGSVASSPSGIACARAGGLAGAASPGPARLSSCRPRP